VFDPRFPLPAGLVRGYWRVFGRRFVTARLGRLGEHSLCEGL